MALLMDLITGPIADFTDTAVSEADSGEEEEEDLE